MKSFHTYFHPDNIIKLLCKYRMKYARKKHKLHLLADISSAEKIIHDLRNKSNVPDELSKLLPSRRNWYKPNPNERKRFTDSQKLQEFALLKTISTIHIRAKKNPGYKPPIWYIELEGFIKKIQDRINDPSIQIIRTPKTKPIKKENTKICKECRPISLYGLEDRIIISLTAKYFTETFDECFDESSFAFRAVKTDESGGKHVRTHHDAIERIVEFHSKHKESDVYVTECDIQKFFDCVNHKLVIDCLESLTSKFKIDLNEKAKEILIQYLESYSFSKDVYPLNKTDYFKDYKMEGAEFKWVLRELKKQFYNTSEYDSDLDNASIGVPQGGALSCFISNLLLHSVDEVVNVKKDDNLLYLRFCDDMVILHTDKTECENALKRYEEAIAKLNFIIHTPEEVKSYSRKFWKVKSKKPYRWASRSGEATNVPWLSFVGYQVKYDGSIRIRKKSLQKELKKQREECQQILKSVNFKEKKEINSISKKSKKQQLFALENRLISMSVGRVKLYDKEKPQSLCWTNGFKALNKNQTSIKQLKLLDRNRSKQLYEVKKGLNELVKPAENPDLNLKKKALGSPYSYHNFILGKKEQDLTLPVLPENP